MTTEQCAKLETEVDRLHHDLLFMAGKQSETGDSVARAAEALGRMVVLLMGFMRESVADVGKLTTETKSLLAETKAVGREVVKLRQRIDACSLRLDPKALAEAMAGIGRRR